MRRPKQSRHVAAFLKMSFPTGRDYGCLSLSAEAVAREKALSPEARAQFSYGIRGTRRDLPYGVTASDRDASTLALVLNADRWAQAA